MEKKKTGKKGEELAKVHLTGLGFTILEQNWRFRHLEVDIIAADEKNIVFVEVKTRQLGHLQDVGDMLGKQKRRNLIDAANVYIEKKDITKEARFDVIAITIANNQYNVEHIKDAFYPEVR